MPKIFLASFNRASDGALSKLRDKIDFLGWWTDEPHFATHIIVPGDRIETFEFVNEWLGRLPIIHLWAGEVSQGTHDEYYRWFITHVSMMQLCTNYDALKRVRDFFEAIGYGKSRIKESHVVGNVMLDNWEIDESDVPSLCSYDVVLLNPCSNQSQTNRDIMQVLNIVDKKHFWFPPNGDNGSEWIINHVTVNDIKRNKFLGIVKNCQRFITNSSSAFYEAQFLLKPEQIIMIGERNKDRESKYADMSIPNASDNIIKILRTLDD